MVSYGYIQHSSSASVIPPEHSLQQACRVLAVIRVTRRLRLQKLLDKDVSNAFTLYVRYRSVPVVAKLAGECKLRSDGTGHIINGIDDPNSAGQTQGKQ